MGMPGPNPGGPGLTPYSGGAPPPASTSAMPPMHHHATTLPTRPPIATSGAADRIYGQQLNQQELARLQAGVPMGAMPPAPHAQPIRGEQHGNARSQHGRTGSHSTGTPHESEHGTVQR